MVGVEDLRSLQLSGPTDKLAIGPQPRQPNIHLATQTRGPLAVAPQPLWPDAQYGAGAAVGKEVGDQGLSGAVGEAEAQGEFFAGATREGLAEIDVVEAGFAADVEVAEFGIGDAIAIGGVAEAEGALLGIEGDLVAEVAEVGTARVGSIVRGVGLIALSEGIAIADDDACSF